jgi:hypothetical protein
MSYIFLFVVIRGRKFMLPIPTDKLYKFLAVGGLLLLGFSFYVSFYAHRDLKLQQIEALRKHDAFTFAHERKNNFWIETASHYQTLSKRYGGECTAEKRSEMEKYEPTLQSNRQRVYQALEETLLASLEAKRTVEHYEFILNWAFVGTVIFSSIGAILSFMGFWCWYREPKNTAVTAARRLSKRH